MKEPIEESELCFEDLMPHEKSPLFMWKHPRTGDHMFTTSALRHMIFYENMTTDEIVEKYHLDKHWLLDRIRLFNVLEGQAYVSRGVYEEFRKDLRGYVEVYYPERATSKKSKYVMVHRLRAEEMLGRELEKGEAVHHIDLDKENNTYDNLYVTKTPHIHIKIHQQLVSILGPLIRADLITFDKNTETYSISAKLADFAQDTRIDALLKACHETKQEVPPAYAETL